MSDGPAVEPEHLERLFVARVNAGDVDGLLDLFEPDAVMAHEDGEVAVGHDSLRPVFEALVASGVQLTLGDQQPVLRFGDLALTSTQLADGGITAEVSRRQPDGTWRWVIDNWDVTPGHATSDDGTPVTPEI
jgi:ketosteroid isomerase-like protein